MAEDQVAEATDLNQASTDAVDTSVSDTDVDSDIEDKPLTDWENDETEEKQESEQTEEPGQATEESTDKADEGEIGTPDQKELARQAYVQRQQIKQQRETERQTQLKEWVNQAEDERDIAIRALQAKDYLNTVEKVESTLLSEYQKAAQEIPMFNRSSPEFNERAYNRAVKDFNAGYVEYDELGNMVGTKENASIYDYLQDTADLLQGVRQSGAVQGQQAQRKQQVIAETPPATPARGTASDDPYEGFGDVRLA